MSNFAVYIGMKFSKAYSAVLLLMMLSVSFKGWSQDGHLLASSFRDAEVQRLLPCL